MILTNQENCQPSAHHKSWRLYAVTRLDVDRWGLVIGCGADSLMFHVNTRQLRSWPLVQTAGYVSHGVWLSGFTRDTWRAAVVTRLAAQRARREG